MTAKDFKAIAEVVRLVITDGDQPIEAINGLDAAEAIAWRLAAVCAATNPQFNLRRFLDACGVHETRVNEYLIGPKG